MGAELSNLTVSWGVGQYLGDYSLQSGAYMSKLIAIAVLAMLIAIMPPDAPVTRRRRLHSHAYSDTPLHPQPRQHRRPRPRRRLLPLAPCPLTSTCQTCAARWLNTGGVIEDDTTYEMLSAVLGDAIEGQS